MLKLRVPFIRGETAASFCSRLALKNRCKSVAEFCLDVGLAFRDVVAGTQDALSMLAHLGGIEFEPLWSSTMRAHGHIHVCGNNLIDGGLRRSMDRLLVCPACIAADLSRWSEVGAAAPAGRTAWLLTPITTCVEHDLALVVADTRPESEAWRTADHHDFAQRVQAFVDGIEHQVASAAYRPATRFERYLHARLDGSPREVDPLVDSLPFYTVAHASQVLGAFDAFGPKVLLKKLTEDQRREAGATGFEILAAGQDVLGARLRENMDRWPKGKNAATVAGHFGSLHAWLLYRCGDTSYEFLRETIRKLMISSRAMRASDSIYGVSPGAQRLHSVRTAAEEIGVHPKRLQRLLIATGLLDKAAARLSAHKAAFPADARATEVLQRIKHCIPKGSAGEYINAPRVQFDLMHKAGLVVPFIPSGAKLKDYGFDTRDLDDFIRRLFASARSPVPDGLGVIQIPAAAKRANCSVVTVIRMILEGQLTSIYRQRGVDDGFMSLLVDPAEICTALKRPKRPGLSIAEVESRMRWTYRVAKALVDNGWLRSRIVTNPVNKRKQVVVETADLHEFDRVFVALTSLAKEHRLFGSAIKAGLEDAGIRPAFDPSVVRATFYRRADLPPP